MKKHITEKLIFIVLGNTCDMQCKYCIEKESRNDINNQINDDLYKFIIDESSFLRGITFYGGEPMLYFDSIKQIVSNLKPANIHFSSMTNGRCITKEMVDYINDNGITINLSWDGENSSYTRGYDVIKENPIVLDINDLWISATITKHSPMSKIINDVSKINPLYKDKHGRPLFLHINTAMKSFDDDIFDIDIEKLREEQYYYLTKDPENDTEFFVQVYMLGVARAKLMNESPPVLKKCGSGINMMILGVDGTIYSCKNNHIPIGSIYDDQRYVTAMALSTDTGCRYANECLKCSVYKLCGGGCRYIGDRERFCSVQKAVFEPMIDIISKEGNNV